MSQPTASIKDKLFVTVDGLLVYWHSSLVVCWQLVVYFLRTAAWLMAGLSSLPVIGCTFQHHLLLVAVHAGSSRPPWQSASPLACNRSVTHPSTGSYGSQRYTSVCALWLSSHTFTWRLYGSWWSLGVVRSLVVLSVPIAVCVCKGLQAGMCTSVQTLFFLGLNVGSYSPWYRLMVCSGIPLSQLAVLQSYTQVQAAWFMVKLSFPVTVCMFKCDLL